MGEKVAVEVSLKQRLVSSLLRFSLCGLAAVGFAAQSAVVRGEQAAVAVGIPVSFADRQHSSLQAAEAVVPAEGTSLKEGMEDRVVGLSVAMVWQEAQVTTAEVARSRRVDKPAPQVMPMESRMGGPGQPLPGETAVIARASPQ